MARARGRPAQAAARPRPPGALPARLHDQAAVRRRRPARRRPHPRRHLFLHRCGEHLRPPLPLLEEGRPRPRRARGCDRGLVRLLLLPPRPRRRHRPAGVVGADVRPRVGDRDRAGRRKYRPRARRRLEPQGARPPVVRRRDHLRGDRAGPDPGDADPARRRVLCARQRWAAGPTPPGRRARRAAGRTGAGDPRRAGRGSEPDRSRAQPHAPMRKLDPWLLLAALAISVGSYLAQSSTPKALATPGFANRQIVWLAVGGVLILLFAFTDYRVLARLSPFLYVASIGVLAAMFVIAPVRAGTCLLYTSPS